MNLQVTINSLDPHLLADFYERADIGYVAEDHTEAIETLLAQGLIELESVAEIGQQRQGFVDTAACTDPSGRLPRLHFQRRHSSPTEEATTAASRLHVDLQFPGDPEARDALIDRLTTIGATRVSVGSQGPVHAWVVMADPEGNVFCVSN